ncbi:MAG: hypothetical protein QMD05_06195 [Candidatus Brocadiaceae bacterium]|nr:hypothetical protein [Candidatus Brocadiaceae bacterium]
MESIDRVNGQTGNEPTRQTRKTMSGIRPFLRLRRIKGRLRRTTDERFL